MTLRLHLITPERVLAEITADHVTVRAVDGEVGVRTGHAPLVALLADGGYVIARVTGDFQFRCFAVHGGVAEVGKDLLRVLAPLAVDAHALDVAALTRKAEATTDAAEKKWLTAQIEVAQLFPAPAGRV
jgi:F-type H+-transporting ATPase subunit epsilon